MVDKVKPLKFETSIDGTEVDYLPTEANPSEDYIAAKGIALANNNDYLVDLDGSNNIQFKDSTETTPINVRQLRTASQNIFSTTGNDYQSTTVQTAIEEIYPQLQTITTDGTTHTLTKYSVRTIVFTGTTANTKLKLPDATTFNKNGKLIDVWNYSDKTIQILDNGSNVLATLTAESHTKLVLRSNSTSNGSWGISYLVNLSNVYGTEFQYSEATSETSTTSTTTWSNKVTITTPSDLPLGDYLINYVALWRSSNANREADFRIQKNSSSLIEWKPSTARTQQIELVSGFEKITSISGTNTFTLDFKNGGSAATIYVSEAKMYLIRIS